MKATEKLLQENKKRLSGFYFLLLCEFEVFVALDATCADLDATAACCLWKCDPLEVGVLAGIT